MWNLLSIVVGSRIGRAVGLVLVAGLISLLTIQYIQKQERDRVLNEVQREDLENYKDTRERIDEANDDSFGLDDALEWLRQRNKD
jgi:hypothetical protein